MCCYIWTQENKTKDLKQCVKNASSFSEKVNDYGSNDSNEPLSSCGN